jgi:hypothetical protein
MRQTILYCQCPLNICPEFSHPNKNKRLTIQKITYMMEKRRPYVVPNLYFIIITSRHKQRLVGVEIDARTEPFKEYKLYG